MMRITWAQILFFLFCVGLPVFAYAQGVFDVSPDDKSMQYLGAVFGGVSDLPITVTGNALFRQLAYIFNEIVFALAIVIVIVTTVIGTLATAQEGEVMGKKWSSLLVPARAGMGVFLLLPGASGYSWIQVGVMWFIIQGVGAANALWQQVIYSSQSQGSLVADTRETDLTNSADAVKTIFKSVVCMQAINNLMIKNPDVDQLFDNDYVSMYVSDDGSQIIFGRQDKTESPLCGSIQVPNVGSNSLVSKMLNSSTSSPARTEQQQELMADAILNAALALEPAAMQSLQPSYTWSPATAQTFVIAARALEGAVSSMAQSFSSLDPIYQKALIDGWIMAGSYYFNLVTGGTYQKIQVTVGNAAAMDTNHITDALGDTRGAALIGSINNATNNYATFVSSTIQTVAPADSVGGSLTPANVSLPGSANDIFDAIFGQGFFGNLATNLGKQITTGCLSNSTDPSQQKGDPVTCMASFGAGMASTTELVFWTAMIVIFGIWLGAQVMSCMQPLAHAMNFVLLIIVPLASAMIGLLWVSGITLALYVPMIPYLVFTFSALSWVILVIETMLAAPLIALTLIIPSEDELGKAAHTLMILFGIFMRPALMILGFIFGMKMISVAINILNFGFAGTLQMTIAHGIGLFGFVSVILVYSGIAVSLVHEAFSLIYVLPDKVLRWMGGHGEDLQSGAQVKQLEGSVEQGAGMGKQFMSGALSSGAGKAKGALKT